jgi:hypothetical protein
VINETDIDWKFNWYWTDIFLAETVCTNN